MQGARDEVDGWLVMARLMAGDGMDDKDIWVWWLPAVFGVFLLTFTCSELQVQATLSSDRRGEGYFSTADAGWHARLECR